MTDEARRIYYSPAHWEKMLAAQDEYIKSVLHRQYDCSNRDAVRRRGMILFSARDRRETFFHNACIMRGCCLNRRQTKLSLLVNGINYGLMLDGLRQHLHSDIDRKFEKVFFIIACKNSLLDAIRAINIKHFDNGHK